MIGEGKERRKKGRKYRRDAEGNEREIERK